MLWGDLAPFLNDDLMLVLVSITTGEHNERIWISVYNKRQSAVAVVRAAAPWRTCLPKSDGQWRSACTAFTQTTMG